MAAPKTSKTIVLVSEARASRRGAQHTLRQSRCAQAKTFIQVPSAKHISTSQTLAGAQLV
jgi:hypothetical protein